MISAVSAQFNPEYPEVTAERNVWDASADRNTETLAKIPYLTPRCVLPVAADLYLQEQATDPPRCRSSRPLDENRHFVAVTTSSNQQAERIQQDLNSSASRRKISTFLLFF